MVVQGQIEKSTNVVEDFNTPLWIIGMTNKQKISKGGGGARKEGKEGRSVGEAKNK